MIELRIEKYTEEKKEKWDDFVLKGSENGTFQQTKNFLDYHQNRFEDSSLVILKGNDTIVGVMPACVSVVAEERILYSHKGSTFGGIVIGQGFNNIEHVIAMIDAVERYAKEQGFTKIVHKTTSEIFAKGNVQLLYYLLFQRGYIAFDELSCYVDFEHYQEDIISNFTSGRRRDYKYSLKYNFDFRKLNSADEVSVYYTILCENLKKFDTTPVHSLPELLDFYNNRLQEIVEFYGVFDQEKMIAGSMLFNFDDQTLHTQYLAADPAYLKMFPMNFLDMNLIKNAKERGFRYFSFGTSTHEMGKVLNKPLAQFKEAFGTQYGINKTFVKKL